MSKWQQLKIVMSGFAYLLTGIVLILGGLTLLGPMMDWLATSYIDNPMPVVIQFIPLLVLLVAIGWGAFFINKGITIGGGLFFYSLGKAVYTILCLRRVSNKVAVILGGSIAIAGFIIICVELGPVIIVNELLERSSVLTVSPLITIMGVLFLFLGIATVEYVSPKHKRRNNVEIETPKL